MTALAAVPGYLDLAQGGNVGPVEAWTTTDDYAKACAAAYEAL